MSERNLKIFYEQASSYLNFHNIGPAIHRKRWKSRTCYLILFYKPDVSPEMYTFKLKSSALTT